VFVVMSFVLMADCAFANMLAAQRQPSQDQLDRLQRFEPYVRYFSSLSYGGARVSPDYIRALILTESGGEPSAMSVKGARGLTQITLSTARTVAEGLLAVGYDFHYIDERDLEALEAEDLFDPAVNILMACYLSATYQAMYEGRMELMVSAWNAGPGAVSRYGNEPPPYPETLAMIARLGGYISYLKTRTPG